MYGTGVVLALDEQRVRLYLLPRGVRLNLLEGVIGVRYSSYGAICTFTSFMRHFVFRIHRNVNNGLE